MNCLVLTLVLSLLGSGNTGTAVFPLLKIGQGPRAAAMGESFTGLADDASAVYWNPAGLGQLKLYEFALSHHEWFAGIRDEIVHAALPSGPGAIGLGLVYSGEPDVRYWDEASQTFKTVLTWSTMLTAGYGLRLSDKYRVGATVTGLYQDLKFAQGYGGAVDLGAVGHPVEGLGIGLAARHLGVMSYDNSSEKLPLEVAAGATYATGKFRMTLDAVLPLLDNSPNVRAGVEFTPVSAVALRAGYRTGPVDLTGIGLLNGLTGGIGVTFHGLVLDYAFVPYGELGLTHRVGLKARLEPPPPPPTIGSQYVVVLDAETRQPLAASLSTSGVKETTAVAGELKVIAKAGTVRVQAALPGYEPKALNYRIVAGKNRTDTILVRRYISNLKIVVYDAKTKQPIRGSVSYQGPASATLAVPAEASGVVVKDIAPGRYVLAVSGPTPDYLPQSCTLEIAEDKTVARDFLLWQRAVTLVLLGINFETGQAEILPQFYPILDSDGIILKQSTTVKRVELGGHTDSRQIHTAQYPSNLELSQARAEAVRQYLITKWGIAPERLIAKGYGDSQPLVPNTTPENMFKNRRTELKILE